MLRCRHAVARSTRQRAAVLVDQPDPGRAHPAVGHAEHDDEDHRQDEHEEQAHPVAERPHAC